MTSRIEDTAGQAALVAHERNLWALWSRFGRGEGCVLHEEEDALWFDTPVPVLPYNAVLRFVVEKDTDRRIDALFAHYSRRKVPFVWLVHPSARPQDLADRLSARGLEEAEVCPGISMDLRGLPEQGGPPTEVEIREVRDRLEVDEALELVAWRWNVPPDVRPALAGVMRAFDVGVPGGAVRYWIARDARGRRWQKSF